MPRRRRATPTHRLVAAIVAILAGEPEGRAQDAGAPSTGRGGEAAELARGKAIVAFGNGGGATACAACHGLSGAGDGSGAFPRLTGSPALYGYKQMQDYRSGARRNAIMSPIAAAMTDREMRDTATWYARARDDVYPPPPADPALVARGATLAALGDPALGVGGCRLCHGAEGAAIPPSMPALAGQFPAYARYQFSMWRQGERRNDLGGAMRDLAQRLSEADVAALAAYYATLTAAADGLEARR